MGRTASPDAPWRASAVPTGLHPHTEETVPPPVTQRAYKAALKNIKKPILVH